jgi:phenylpyruvate tautomerase PptA (4-oxalocrotonate tautomerase family)
MPMIDVIFAKGSLDEAAKAQLNATLWEIALRWEGIEATEEAASVAWVFLDERPEGHVSVGGKPPGQSIYRLNVRVMVGFMDQERIDRMVAELTKAVLAADGKVGDGNPRVFCIVEEIPSGTWGIDGKVWTTVFTAQTLGLDKGRVERMRAVVTERPRLDVKIPLEA